MRRVCTFGLIMLALAACGGKKPAPVDAPPPPADDVAKADDAAAKTEDAAMAPETAVEAPPDAAAKAPDDAAAAAADATPAGETAAVAPSPETLARGGYLAGIMGCALCHTAFGPTGPALDKMWAGGLEMAEAFGTWRSPNISQDKKTGIGGWTDQEIINAVREGKRPDGTMLYPIMPYPFYNRMSDSDAKALVAFLRTLPAIENTVAGNDLQMPKTPVPAATGAEPEAGQVKQGEYLTTLMHCAACHTSYGPDGPNMAKWMAGGDAMEMPPMFGEGKLYPSNLTPHATGIGGWTDAELTTALRELKKRDGSPIQGPMQMYQASWSKMPDADVNAIIAFLRSQAPIDNAVPKSTFKPHPPPGGAPAADAGAAAMPDAGAAPGEKSDASP